ncbi:hypothetical protein TRIUR3_04930 [Triticum urartu]|uniref:Uncharacterized protein n=1 Tax=Triticum urartu TaxID=4572 RepID=M8A2Z0_TRIUA|nr:hypothetical protein TRIUR3_04930 [Triticum urartu]
MDRKVCISLAILALVLAGPGTTRAAAAFAGGTASIDVAAVARQLMPTPLSWSSMRLEDGVAVDLEHEVHRRVLAGQGNLGYGALDSKGPACHGRGKAVGVDWYWVDGCRRRTLRTHA